MDLLKNLKKFLSKNLDFTKPILLAYSGGTDSACLLDLLLKVKDEYKIDLHVAHVDHGWRKESGFQALEIKEKMKELKISFHLKKLKMAPIKLDPIRLEPKKNLENESRNQRILFFKSLFKKYKYQALITAHQKDDLAETVLKRFLEGANIFSLTSMQKVSKFDDFLIFRPLLDVKKTDILAYLNQNKINYYIDSTNKNTKFLRAKMRVDIFPFLQKNFNKQILDNLAQISSYSLELNNYLESKTVKIFDKMKISPFGLYIDLNEVNQSLELKFIIKKIAKLKDLDLDLSRHILEKLIFWILQKKPNLRVNLKNAKIFVDRGSFFILRNNYNSFNEKILVKPGCFDFDNWQVQVSRIKNDSNIDYSQSCWQCLFINELIIYLPENKYYMTYPASNKYLKKLWENYKIPSFLRREVPIACSEGGETYEFLSGKRFKLNTENIFKIVIKLK
ncbi:MAG: tRNA(Ile)-lysidine synthase [Candidatus Anoxychlamydiales bacterium]|nr:tRNA(Ile)-lysidine synthase [Candidatus Anoxychlamydiales bacterium]